MGHKTVTMEECGRGLNGCVECEIEYDAQPGEARTWDYPGSDPTSELCSVHVTSYISDTHEFKREDRPDWFEWLDKVAFSMLEADWEAQEESIFEDLAAAEEDTRW